MLVGFMLPQHVQVRVNRLNKHSIDIPSGVYSRNARLYVGYVIDMFTLLFKSSSRCLHTNRSSMFDVHNVIKIFIPASALKSPIYLLDM